MEVMLNGRPKSGRRPQAEALQAVRIAEASGEEPMLLAYYPVANVNPYQALTYRRFAESGIGTLPLYDRDDAATLASLRRFDVRVALHLHWIAWVLEDAVGERDAQERVDHAIAWLQGLREQGLALIWSVHNVLPHDVVFVDAQVRLQQWLADNVDVVHVLSRNTPEAVDHMMTVPAEKTVYAPHPHYRGAYSDVLTREQARSMLAVDPDEIVYLMVGAIKAYKGVGRLLPALDGLGLSPPRRLIVAGKADASPETAQFVADCRRHTRVLIDNRTIPDGEMQIYLRAADVAVLPYQRTLNSGAALLALSFGVPVVAPAVGALAEFLTADCAEIYDPNREGGFAEALRRADRLVSPEARLAATSVAAQFDPDALSRAFAIELRKRLTGFVGRPTVVSQPSSSTGESVSLSSDHVNALRQTESDAHAYQAVVPVGGPLSTIAGTPHPPTTVKKVGLVGYFGWGNYGDELFLKVWQEHLGQIAELRVMHDQLDRPHFSRPVKEVVSEVDAVLIGGGDLVIPWSVSDLYWKEEYLERPVYIVGVGVPTWRRPDPAVIDRMRRFIQHPNVRYIAARDPESAQWIRDNLQPAVDVVWAPDLVFAMSLPPAERDADAEARVLSIATRYRRRGPDDLTQLYRLADRAMSTGWRVRNVVLGTGRTGSADLDVAKEFERSGVEVLHSENLDVLTAALGASDAVASMKFHGTVVATAYGVPCIPVAATDKSRNLFRLIDRLPMMASLQDVTLPDRLSLCSLPVPRIIRNHLRWRVVKQMAELRQALLDA